MGRAKVLGFLAVGLAVLVAQIALAGGSGGGPNANASSLKGKVKKLQQQVDELTALVQNLQQQPGPPGPPGEPGKPGDPASIGPDSVALGTQTTGDYVGSVATNNGLTGGAAGSEGAALTLGLDYTSTLSVNTLGSDQTAFGSTGVLFEGTADANEMLLTPANPTVDRTITIPNQTGTVALQGAIGVVSLNPIPSTGGGVPVVYRFAVANGGDLANFASRGFEVTDAWSVATSNDAGTWQLTDETGDPISDAVDPAADQAITRASTINDAFSDISGGQNLRLDATGNIDANVYVLAIPE